MRFTKMHGLGNDFIVLDSLTQTVTLTKEKIKTLANRNTGIGCDQLLLISESTDPACDFRYQIFNADGNEVSQCGNGARCLAKFIIDNNLSDKKTLTLQTQQGHLKVTYDAPNQASAELAVPTFDAAKIPLQLDQAQAPYQLTIENIPFEFYAVNVGNPHAVLLTTDLTQVQVDSLGRALQTHPAFPEQVNVGFMQVDSPEAIHLRVYERGVGETQACGSGACAAAVIGQHYADLAPDVTVHMPGGALKVAWAGEGTPVILTGPAATVFEGEIQ